MAEVTACRLGGDGAPLTVDSRIIERQRGRGDPAATPRPSGA
jgi:hypothetical protein